MSWSIYCHISLRNQHRAVPIRGHSSGRQKQSMLLDCELDPQKQAGWKGISTKGCKHDLFKDLINIYQHYIHQPMESHQNTTKTGNWIAWPPIHVIFMVLFPQASVTVREPSLSPQAWNIQPTGQPPELCVSWFDVGVMKLPWNLHGRWVVDPLIPQHLITYVI